ncbi:MAG TPA: hypothetical protein VEU53_05510 [Stellaceae bacterium]|nr:hypothetical protein [Stellaceae bacterium]
MRSALSLDVAQLNHLRAKIVELEARPPIEQARKQCLLQALKIEERSLRHYTRRFQTATATHQMA